MYVGLSLLSNNYWSFGEPADDVYTFNYSPDELMGEIKDGNYEYVAIYKCNDSFRNKYSELFVPGTVIDSERLYRFNTDGLLEECIE